MLIQPDGKIVTVGPREVGQNFHFDFGATRHDAAGHLDPSFGAGGIATTDLGGNDDKALDAALLPDGGFVAVGQADPAGLANIDFGVVRYTADGHPDPSFNRTGIETTDIAGRGDVANAVAVQPDGKIVAAGEAETAPGRVRFRGGALQHRRHARHELRRRRDRHHRPRLRVRRRHRDRASSPTARSSSPATPTRTSALARYLPNGQLDPTFNAGGTVVSNIGTNDRQRRRRHPRRDDPDRRHPRRPQRRTTRSSPATAPTASSTSGSATSASPRPT